MTLLSLLTDILVKFIEELGLLGIFLTMAAESCLIPIPSEIVMPFSGYVAWLNNSWIFVFEATAASTLGNLLGSTILYYIGVVLGRPFMKRYGRYFMVREEELNFAEKLFNKYGAYSVFFGRMMPAVRTIISFPAGLFNLNIKKFALLTLTGSIPWNFMLTYFGFLLGPYWTIIISYSTYIDILVLASIAAFLVYIILRSKGIK